MDTLLSFVSVRPAGRHGAISLLVPVGLHVSAAAPDLLEAPEQRQTCTAFINVHVNVC